VGQKTENLTARSRSLATLLIVATAASCGGNASASGPIGVSNEFGGVAYTAEIREIVSTTTRRFMVVVTLSNTRGIAATRTYPAGCPVRIRLYRVSDGVLVYDESKTPCAVTDPVTVTLFAGESMTLQSGVRWPPNVLGDSLAAVRYYVGAVVQTEGTQFVEIAAGVYRMPLCVELVGTEEEIGQTVCN
jgi:hypothetical protein